MNKSYQTVSAKFNLRIPPRTISIDCGLIRTKLLFLDFNTEKEIRFYTFSTSELHKNLKDFQKKYSLSSEDTTIKVRITGDNHLYAESIAKVLWSTKVVLVEEVNALTKGFNILAENVAESDLLFNFIEKVEEVNSSYKMDESNAFVKRFNATMNMNIPCPQVSEDGRIIIPAIIMWAGASIKYYLWREHEQIKLLSSTLIGGETFKGLSKLLVDSNDYDQVTEEGYNGNREHVDTQIYEVMSDDPKSPYGLLPPLIPIFPFGKCGDRNIGCQELCKNDLMNSLSNFIFGESFFLLTKLCQTYGISTVYIGGDTFKSQVFAKHLKFRQRQQFKKICGKVLDCSYVLALGAALDQN